MSINGSNYSLLAERARNTTIVQAKKFNRYFSQLYEIKEPEVQNNICSLFANVAGKFSSACRFMRYEVEDLLKQNKSSEEKIAALTKIQETFAQFYNELVIVRCHIAQFSNDSLTGEKEFETRLPIPLIELNELKDIFNQFLEESISEQKKPLNSLSSDVLGLIVSKAAYRDVRTLACVSRRLRQLVLKTHLPYTYLSEVCLQVAQFIPQMKTHKSIRPSIENDLEKFCLDLQCKEYTPEEFRAQRAELQKLFQRIFERGPCGELGPALSHRIEGLKNWQIAPAFDTFYETPLLAVFEDQKRRLFSVRIDPATCSALIGRIVVQTAPSTHFLKMVAAAK